MVHWCRANREFNREIDTMDVFNALKLVIEFLEEIMSAIDDLKAQVEATVGAEASAVTLIQGLADELKAALANAGVSDPALVDLTTKLHNSADALAAAVTANAPAPAVPTPPVVADPAPAPADPAAGDPAAPTA
jgi:hypothetical protein